MKQIDIYCDGSCKMEPSIGGWGIAVVYKNRIVNELYGRLRPGFQTNNRAELEAFLHSLLWLDKNIRICSHYTIHSDSLTLIGGVEGSSKREFNRDIWSQIEYMCSKLIGKFDIQYCESHIDKYNIVADALARQATNSLILQPKNIIIKEMAQSV